MANNLDEIRQNVYALSHAIDALTRASLTSTEIEKVLLANAKLLEPEKLVSGEVGDSVSGD